MSAFGMPGPGGSLGQCAVCGQNFLLEIITGQTVKTLHIEGVTEELFIHAACAPLIKNGMDWKDLPAASPLRAAWEKAKS